MTIYSFAKCTKNEQEELIQSKGLFIDSWNENDNLINLYYLNGFFVEVALSLFHNDPVEIIPYKRGYKLTQKQSLLVAGFGCIKKTAKVAA